MSTHYNPLIVRDGLIVNVDAANKLSYPGTGNTWFDLSKNGKNGSMTGGASFSSDFGGVIDFDGINDYVNFGIGNTFLPMAAFAVDIWFRCFGLVSPSTSSGLFGFTYAVRLVLDESSMSFRCHDGTNTTSVSSSGSTNFRDGSWYNVVAYHTGSVQGIYVNSKFRGSINASWPGTSNWPTNGWGLGADQNNVSATRFYGQMATYKMYNRALTPQEMQQNFNAARRRFGV